MSEASKKFWQDQISRKGEIVVPDLLDDWAAVVLREYIDVLNSNDVTKDLRDESDRYFTELQAERARAAKLVEALETAKFAIESIASEIENRNKGVNIDTTAQCAKSHAERIGIIIAAHKKGGQNE